MKSGNIADVKYCHDEDEAPRLDEDTDIYLSEGESFQDLNTFDFALVRHLPNFSSLA